MRLIQPEGFLAIEPIIIVSVDLVTVFNRKTMHDIV